MTVIHERIETRSFLKCLLNSWLRLLHSRVAPVVGHCSRVLEVHSQSLTLPTESGPGILRSDEISFELQVVSLQINNSKVSRDLQAQAAILCATAIQRQGPA